MTQQDSKKTSILYVITKSNWGGAQRYVFDLATDLPKDRFDIKVALGGNGILVEKLHQENIATIQIPDLERDIFLWKDIKSFLNLIKIFRKENPDVIHLNSSKIGGLGALAGRIVGVKKIIFTVHGFAFNESRNFISIFLIKLASYLTLLLSTDIIFVTKYDLDCLPKWLQNKSKNKIIHNAIKSPEFLSRDDARNFLLSKANISNKELPIVLSIGELTKNKDYETAIEACNLTKTQFNYLIISDGEDKERLENLIKDKNLENVYLLGQIPNASTYLKGADLFLLSSRKEGLPYVILEALQAEIPIISTNVGGISEVLPNEFLVPKETPVELANKIDELLSQPKTPSSKYVDINEFLRQTQTVYTGEK